MSTRRPSHSIVRFTAAALVVTLLTPAAFSAIRPDAERWPDTKPTKKVDDKPKTKKPKKLYDKCPQGAEGDCRHTKDKVRTCPEDPKTEPKPVVPDPVVSVELAMLVDASDSVDDHEYRLQKMGYVNAFRDPDLHSVITGQDGVAVSFIEWSSTKQQHRSNWRILRTAQDCIDFAASVESSSRRFRHNTIMATALGRAAWELNKNKIEGGRRVIDVSGDGMCENYHYYLDAKPVDDRYGHRWQDIRNWIADDITINAISIGNTPGLQGWYANQVPMGPDHFAMHADTFEAFNEAIKRKLIRELTDPADLIGYD